MNCQSTEMVRLLGVILASLIISLAPLIIAQPADTVGTNPQAVFLLS